MKFINITDKNMSNGMRDMSKTPLTEEEIAFVKAEIARIEADPSVFVFNDEEHIAESTCYDFVSDLIYVTRNVFPETKYGSTHPRDLMSVAAVLAHEYYGHRPYRDEYLSDYAKEEADRTTPLWQDECRASITAAKTTPNLNDSERSNLIYDAVFRAREYGHLIEMDDFMKEVVYGYTTDSKRNITPSITPIVYVREASEERVESERRDDGNLSQVRRKTHHKDDRER